MTGFNSPSWRYKIKSRRFFNIIKRDTFHRITHIDPGTWTLFAHTQKRVKAWGFITPVPEGVLWKPYNTSSEHDWYKTNPKGKDSKREPIRVGRISIDSNNPTYTPKAHGATVFLDGKKVDHVITADDETGEVQINLLNEDGEPFIDRNTRKIARKWLFGHVRIELPKTHGVAA